jgi:hypothetical protein
MQLYSTCPGCGKPLTLDLRHKEPYAPMTEPTVVAQERCDECRQQLTISITISPEGKAA